MPTTRGVVNLWPISARSLPSLLSHATIGLKDAVLWSGDATGTRVVAEVWRDGKIMALGFGCGREVDIPRIVQHM